MAPAGAKFFKDKKMRCLKPIRLMKNIDFELYPDGLVVPCGKCLNCRIQKRTEWTLRVIHESEFWKDKMFVTLTYNDESLPENGSLKKKDLQLFFKRLRKNYGKKIKYFACGEYGDNTNRPHYHMVLFGVDWDDKNVIYNSWKHSDWNPAIKANAIKTVIPERIQYVCKYIDKAYTIEMERDDYEKKGIEVPFRLVSNGMGLQYLEKHRRKIEDLGYVSFRGKKRSLPRYYLNKTEIDVDEIYKEAEKIEKEEVEKIVGEKLTRDQAYRFLRPDEVLKLEEGIKKRRQQHDKNLRAISNKDKRSF